MRESVSGQGLKMHVLQANATLRGACIALESILHLCVLTFWTQAIDQ